MKRLILLAALALPAVSPGASAQTIEELARDLLAVRHDYHELGLRASALASERDAVASERDAARAEAATDAALALG